MDHFGIGHAMQCMARVYVQSARRTGRTTSMVESLKNGDRVVFLDTREAERVQRMCRERDLKVECIVVPPREPQLLFERGTSEGRTLFDHSWVERYYLDAIEKREKEIDFFQRETSGFGEAHLETRRRAEEVARWRP